MNKCHDKKTGQFCSEYNRFIRNATMGLNEYKKHDVLATELKRQAKLWRKTARRIG